MNSSTWTLRRLRTVGETQIEQLAEVLIDCVEGGASVSFMLPLTRERATRFWHRVAVDVASGARALLVAEDALGICGTAQLVFDLPENQPHRADLAKMLVRLGWVRVGTIPDYALMPDGAPCATTIYYRQLESTPS